MSVYICESVNLNGEASDEASPFSFNRISRPTGGQDARSLSTNPSSVKKSLKFLY